jgi:hypothetical protein
MLLRVGLVLLGREARADEGGCGNVSTGVVCQLDALADEAARHGYGSLAEGLLLLLAESVEVLLLLDLLPDHRLLGVREVGVKRAPSGGGVDVDDPTNACYCPITRLG